MKISLPSILGLAYLISELALAFSRRSSGTAVSKDANSLWILWAVIAVSIWFSLRSQHQWPQAVLPPWSVPVGVTVFVVGTVLRWYSIIHLGRFFTVNVAIASDHQLVDTGPYRFVRHPSYTGALLAFIGFALVLRNWASLLIISLPIAVAFIYRIKVEEDALTQALGDRYRGYMTRTKRLIPFVY
ncbi:MAG: isoprenylcysteine carboxylmethyltransferase family protein [Verrucomicrobiota bacterium]|nr:isoprenylcysteine carboxylmethyltransferase family protein [Verrucomicrobiota bacterium]